MLPLRARILGIIGLSVLLCAVSPASAGLPGIPGVPLPKPPLPTLPKLPSLPIPDVSQLISGEDAVSTNLGDAVTSIPFLNAYQPVDVAPLQDGTRTGGSYDVPSGSYLFESRSYCLHAGKYFAVKGGGYLYAPLKGSKADIIRNILVRSVDHLEIPQREVQQLIWAIEARARVGDLSPQLQADAVKLLSPAQILLLDHSGLGVVPGDRMAALLAKVPDPLKPVVQAENSLRGLLTANPTYEALEQVAVPHAPAQLTQLPPVRWSFAREGYFVWYMPHAYWWTTDLIDVPGAVHMTQDSLGRISLLQAIDGSSMAISYDSSTAGAPRVAGDPDVRFYRIHSIRFAWEHKNNGKTDTQTQSWAADSWVMVGVPNGKGRISGSGEQQSYTSASALRDQFHRLLATVRGDSQALVPLMALAELQGTLHSLSQGRQSRSPVIDQELNFPFAAWESVFAHSLGGHIAAHVAAGIDDPVNLPDGVGQPQDPGAQRLAQSPAPGCDLPPGGTGTTAQQAIAKGLSDGGYPRAGSNPQYISTETVGNDTIYWHVNLDNSGNPISPCLPDTPPYGFYGVIKQDGDNLNATTGSTHNFQKTGEGSGSAPYPYASSAIKNSLQAIHY